MELFPVPIHSEKFNLNVKEMAKYCLAMKKTTKSSNVSNKGGWQSPRLTGEHAPLNDLFKEILRVGEHYRKRIAYKDPLKIDTVWININGYKDYNIEHSHNYSVVSGSFYLTPNNSEIAFLHPASSFLAYDWPSSSLSEHNKYNSAVWKMTPLENQVILFPGWFKHRVEPNLNKKEKRISISFNLI
jgi:uncharacterized protein (TIGR02466 family)|tara:strand:+ start:964 stop:1521 length:558 start_codon:yes stop_codon:yes gene_type:complete